MKVEQEWVDLAVEAAELGGSVLNEFFGKTDPASIISKSRGDWVSEADNASEDVIMALLKQKASDHQILTEEAGQIRSNPDSVFRWIIDPLDGTTNFLRGFPIWAVSVALEYKSDIKDRWGEIIAGAICIPSTNEMFHAGKGLGAFRNDTAIHVSKDRSFRDSLLATGFPFRTRNLVGEYLELFGKILQECADVRRPGAVAVDLCYVAAGIFDGFWELDLGPWDIAAGSLIISEAGGKFSNFQGGNDIMSSGDIVASNPELFPELLKLVKGSFPESRDENMKTYR
ncbi:MAG: inositol monophosphatase [Calditrichaeota bacterium]|nr:inositol monophosphatase [Calditrichota bacterium]